MSRDPDTLRFFRTASELYIFTPYNLIGIDYMMRRLFFSIPLLLLFSLSSCFQLIEEITMKNDGSGDMQITLNLSQSNPNWHPSCCWIV
ncbi:MAG: hypothetical protein WDO19_02430 [Bacteroidota bacterium]